MMLNDDGNGGETVQNWLVEEGDRYLVTTGLFNLMGRGCFDENMEDF